MNDIAHQFLALLRKTLSDIHQAVQELRLIQIAIDPGYEKYSADNQSEAPEKDSEVLAVIKAFHETNSSSEAKKYTLDHRRYRLEWKSYTLTRWTAAFLLLYTTLTAIIAIYSIRSANAARKSADATMQSLETQNRAWLTVSFDSGTDPRTKVQRSDSLMVVDGKFVEHMKAINSGRGPAIRLTGKAKAVLLPDDVPPGLF
jgi:hypothetical protein